MLVLLRGVGVVRVGPSAHSKVAGRLCGGPPAGKRHIFKLAGAVDVADLRALQRLLSPDQVTDLITCEACKAALVQEALERAG